MQASVKSNITARKSESLKDKKDSKNHTPHPGQVLMRADGVFRNLQQPSVSPVASNINAKTDILQNKYVMIHLNNNLIPGMVSFCDDSDYINAIKNY